MIMKKWEKFTDEELKEMVQNSTSIRDLAINLGYSADSGSGASAIKEMLAIKNFDTSHFTGQAWNKGNFDYERFRYGNNIKAADAVDAITAIRGHKCECCKQELWMDKPIPLEVHHIDGDKLNNTLDNLQLLCPNCHALTENYRGKNMNRNHDNYVSDEDFINALKSTPNVRQALLKLGLTAKGANYNRAYNLLNKYNITQLKK
jgi:hypothetical protein